MKKYYPIDFDEKGNAVLGTAKNTPTSNGFIPTTWTPGGGSEDEGSGIKSITISPSITTTPALDSVFPVYYDDLTDEEKESGKDITFTVGSLPAGSYSATVSPTSNWYAATYNGGVPSFATSQGEPATYSAFEVQEGDETARFDAFVANTNNPGPDMEFVSVTVILNKNGQ